jgi:predicted dehydrogenase
MTELLAVAVAGAGMISRYHLLAWKKLYNVRVVGIADPIRDKVQERAREFGISAVFDDVATMLDELRPDILDIASPVETHASVAHLAAQYGIAILCQKPVAPTYAEAASLMPLADTVPFMVHENWRFRAPYRFARDWICQGLIGTVHRFVISTESSGLLSQNGDTPAALVRQPFFASMPRLMIFEALIHHLDLARTLCGELTVTAASVTHTCSAVRGEDRAIVQLQGEDSIGVVIGDYAVPGRPPVGTDSVQIVGSAGQILFDGERLSLVGPNGEIRSQRFERETVYQSAFDGAIQHFLDRFRKGQTFETSLTDNLRTLRLVEDSYQLAERPTVPGPEP